MGRMEISHIKCDVCGVEFNVSIEKADNFRYVLPVTVNSSVSHYMDQRTLDLCNDCARRAVVIELARHGDSGLLTYGFKEG